jgi:hypothetical protein
MDNIKLQSEIFLQLGADGAFNAPPAANRCTLYITFLRVHGNIPIIDTVQVYLKILQHEHLDLEECQVLHSMKT